VRGSGGGNCAAKDSAIRKHRTSEPKIVEDVMKVERLSPHPFQPSQREEVKTRGPQLFAQPRPNERLMKMILPSALVISSGMGAE
jgi:hypothetical protein